MARARRRGSLLHEHLHRSGDGKPVSLSVDQRLDVGEELAVTLHDCLSLDEVDQDIEFIPCVISLITDDQGFRKAAYQYMDVVNACDKAYSGGNQVEQCIVNVCNAYGCEGAGCGNLCA
jgi:hypothetical protein